MVRRKVVEPIADDIVEQTVTAPVEGVNTKVVSQETYTETVSENPPQSLNPDTIIEKPLTIKPIDDEVVVDRFYINALLENTVDEIERCNDYIDSGMDANQTFAVYKKELREYRYKLRQVQFQPGYPMNVILPQKPVAPKDE